MTSPNSANTANTAANATPVVTQTHTWIYVALTTFGTILAAFAPKIQAYASVHPTGAIVAGGVASVIGSFLPSVAKGN